MNWTELALRPLAFRPFSRAMGSLADWKAPKPVLSRALRLYVDKYGVDLDEMAEPLDSYDSFNAFFTRALRPGIRPVDTDPQTLVSPVDGFALQHGRVQDGQIFQAKGRGYSLTELLADGALARQMTGGGFCTIYLSPASYHRIHSPSDGEITGYRYIPGPLFPVNSIAVNAVDRLFARNERLATVMDGTPAGRFVLVAVGATNVGSITVTYDTLTTNRPRPHATSVDYAESISIQRAEELARFNLGSTVVLVWEDGDFHCGDLREHSEVRLGQRLITR